MARALIAVGTALALLIAGLALAVYVTRDEDNIQVDNLLSERFTREVATASANGTDLDLPAIAPVPWARVLIVRRGPYDRATMRLVVDDPLAHRALDGLLRAEAAVRRRLSGDLEREGLSAAGFSVLVVLVTAGGELELRTLRRRLHTSKANATEIVDTLERRGLVSRHRLEHDRRAAAVTITEHGEELVERLFPEHAERVARAFSPLDDTEKRTLAELCRKLAA